MANEDWLLHHNLLGLVPFGESVMSRLLRQRISDTLVDDQDDDPSVSVVVRAFNEASQLELLCEDIRRQVFGSAVEVVVVDNGSSDNTPQVAKHYGAEVVTLPQAEFTYPKSLNLGMEAASNDVVFVTVAHANLSNIYNLHAGARHFSKSENIAGAYGINLPNAGASTFDRWRTVVGTNLYFARPAQPVMEAGLGVLSSTGSMISKRVWRELGRFDEHYGHGGEDMALARMMLKNGYDIVQEPALAIHHSHPLGTLDSIKQLGYWRQIQKPVQFDRQELLRRRPDLRANTSASDLYDPTLRRISNQGRQVEMAGVRYLQILDLAAECAAARNRGLNPLRQNDGILLADDDEHRLVQRPLREGNPAQRLPQLRDVFTTIWLHLVRRAEPLDDRPPKDRCRSMKSAER
jgi:GT2 family glycosyltransferase